MADRLTPAARSRNMSRVKGRNTKPEMLVRQLLHRMGYRFRLHRKDLPGKPDIVLPRYKTVIFVHGCFWHGHPGCRRATRPADNAEFWRIKLDGNIVRDQAVLTALTSAGWHSHIVWECETHDVAVMERRLKQLMAEKKIRQSHEQR